MEVASPERTPAAAETRARPAAPQCRGDQASNRYLYGKFARPSCIVGNDPGEEEEEEEVEEEEEGELEEEEEEGELEEKGEQEEEEEEGEQKWER